MPTKLVEEFMLLANRTVAEKVGRVPKNKKPKVLPYRIHDLPDPEKLENLSQFIARFGYKGTYKRNENRYIKVDQPFAGRYSWQEGGKPD